MRIKHYSYFKSNPLSLDWDSLRNDETETPYYLPYSYDKYLIRVQSPHPSIITESIISKAKTEGINKIFSIGSGIAAQEYQLKKYSDLYVAVSDYSSSILRIKAFNIFDDCMQLDILKDNIPVDKNYLVLFPRIDTEFNDSQLNLLFKKFHDKGVRYICFIPAQLMSFRVIYGEIKTLLVSLLRRKKLIFCGYTRSKSSLIKAWSQYYEIDNSSNSNLNFFFLIVKQND
jgi:hypothetical protein